jgi:hypothetical protein
MMCYWSAGAGEHEKELKADEEKEAKSGGQERDRGGGGRGGRAVREAKRSYAARARRKRDKRALFLVTGEDMREAEVVEADLDVAASMRRDLEGGRGRARRPRC